MYTYFREGDLGFSSDSPPGIFDVDETGVGTGWLTIPREPGQYLVFARVAVLESSGSLSLSLRLLVEEGRDGEDFVYSTRDIDQAEVGPGKQAVTLVGPLQWNELSSFWGHDRVMYYRDVPQLQVWAQAEAGNTARVQTRIMFLKVSEFRQEG